jgi:hypothetical protein
MSDSPHSTLNSPIQQTAVEIQIGDGPSPRILYIPVEDSAEALKLMQRINKTPGKLIFGENTPAPMTIHCGRVVFMNTVLLPPSTQTVPVPPKIATLRH